MITILAGVAYLAALGILKVAYRDIYKKKQPNYLN